MTIKRNFPSLCVRRVYVTRHKLCRRCCHRMKSNRINCCRVVCGGLCLVPCAVGSCRRINGSSLLTRDSIARNCSIIYNSYCSINLYSLYCLNFDSHAFGIGIGDMETTFSRRRNQNGYAILSSQTGVAYTPHSHSVSGRFTPGQTMVRLSTSMPHESPRSLYAPICLLFWLELSLETTNRTTHTHTHSATQTHNHAAKENRFWWATGAQRHSVVCHWLDVQVLGTHCAVLLHREIAFVYLFQ